MTLGNADEVIEGTSSKIISTETLLALAYQIFAKLREAKVVLQVGIYQRIGCLLWPFSIISYFVRTRQHSLMKHTGRRLLSLRLLT